jgi:hypothetical protein
LLSSAHAGLRISLGVLVSLLRLPFAICSRAIFEAVVIIIIVMVVLPDEGLVVTDISVVHPAANSFLQWAAHTAGATASARESAKSHKYDGGGQVAGGSFTLLSMEFYGRLGQPATQLLKSLCSVVFVAVCYVVVSDACHCLYAVDLWLSVLRGLFIPICFLCLGITILDVSRGSLC